MKPLPLKFDVDGLIPVVIQDDQSNAVLMLAFMNADALRLTRESGLTHFWSRTRQTLWRKGEASGNEQIVKSIHVNCHQDSLLIRVQQVGAVCHTGFPTCYYRELHPSNELVETEHRVFDPEELYGIHSAETVRVWIGAYCWLADHDLVSISATSRMLREGAADDLASRVADELKELAGVLSGTHSHGDIDNDVLLEGSQVLYWCVLYALRSGLSAREISGALNFSARQTPTGLAAEDVRSVAAMWDAPQSLDLVEALAATVAVVARAAQAVDRTLMAVIERDLDDLRSRPYLAPYFAEQTS